MIVEITNIKDMSYNNNCRAVDEIDTREKADAYAKAFSPEARLYWLKPAGVVFREETCHTDAS